MQYRNAAVILLQGGPRDSFWSCRCPNRLELAHLLLRCALCIVAFHFNLAPWDLVKLAIGPFPQIWMNILHAHHITLMLLRKGKSMYLTSSAIHRDLAERVHQDTKGTPFKVLCMFHK